jgi:hypothetical protein
MTKTKNDDRECKIILQEIVNRSEEPQILNPLIKQSPHQRHSLRWTAICRCGQYKYGNEIECTHWAEDHSDQRLLGPKIVTYESTVAVPITDFPKDRWVWHAQNDCDEEPWYHGLGRTQNEAIDDLHRTDDIRRMTRSDQKVGLPRNSTWLDFFLYQAV